MQLLRKHIGILAALLLLRAAYAWGNITCPILLLTGHRCPTCGTTRALLALLHGDFQQYLYYQPMALPLLFAAILCIHIHLMKNPGKILALLTAVGILLFNGIWYFSTL